MNIKKYLSDVQLDEERNNTLLHLTANEPFMSEMSRAALSLRIGERYYFGGGDDEGVVDFQPSTHLGLPGTQSIVDQASVALKRMLGAAEINLGCLSGVHAMMCAVLCTTKPGDVVMSVGLESGGHFATKSIIENVGRKHISAPYDTATMSFDVDELKSVYEQSGCSAFYMDVSFYLHPHNLKEIRAALGPDAIIIYDASHTIGLIMAGAFQDPFREGANVICANTHKTLPGPQKGLIAFRDADFGKKANEIINGGLYSSPHTGSMVSLSIAILEIDEYGVDYASQVIKNANALGAALELHGLNIRKAKTGRFSENHQVHLLTDEIGQYRDLYRKIVANNISVNFADALGGGMFIRLGTQEITRRGMKENDMRTIADFMVASFDGRDIASEVSDFISQYQHAHYSFDE